VHALSGALALGVYFQRFLEVKQTFLRITDSGKD
jgi:hypothetical protein